MKKNNQGFTLVELLAVIAILAVIATIAYPLITNTINSSKKNLSKNQEKMILEAARLYAIKNVSESCKCVTVSQLQSSGYLESKDAKDPETGATFTGYVTMNWESSENQYSYTYGNSCGCSSEDSSES